MESVRYGKRQGTLKNDSEWRTARRMRFAIQCSPRRFPYAFAVPFLIYCFQYSLFRSPLAAPFAIRLVIRRAICHAVSYSFPQFSLFKVRYAMFAAPLAIRSSPFVSRRAIRRAFAVAFQCPLTLSIVRGH